ncbi:hypothetical protein FXO38_29410 [Capsicum annuum]|nr:hypothetical protein FXO38_29410 [Capsicum annuum]
MTIEKHCYGGKDDTGGTKAKVVGMNTSVVPKIDVEFCRERKRDLIGNARALGRSRIACNRVKRTIYSTAQTTTEVDSLFKGIESYAIITWARFEELCLSMLFKSMEPVGKCLNEAKVDNVHIQEMVLVSRSSRLPIIQHLLMNYIDEKKLYASINLDDDATCGAAVLDTILIGNGDENVQELLVVDFLREMCQVMDLVMTMIASLRRRMLLLRKCLPSYESSDGSSSEDGNTSYSEDVVVNKAPSSSSAKEDSCDESGDGTSSEDGSTSGEEDVVAKKAPAAASQKEESSDKSSDADDARAYVT